MYFTPRGIDEREQRVIDCVTAQRFLEVVVSGGDIARFFKHFGISKIAIAGASHFGKCLAKLLNESDVKVVCFVDKLYYKYSNEKLTGIPIVSYKCIESMDDLDAIVVASNFYYNEIVDTLIEQGFELEKIMSINDILFGLERIK